MRSNINAIANNPYLDMVGVGSSRLSSPTTPATAEYSHSKNASSNDAFADNLQNIDNLREAIEAISIGKLKPRKIKKHKPRVAGRTLDLQKEAHRQVQWAVRQRLMRIPKKCQCCGGPKSRLEAHHNDYKKPLAVRWLCRSCHRAWHERHVPKNMPKLTAKI